MTVATAVGTISMAIATIAKAVATVAMAVATAVVSVATSDFDNRPHHFNPGKYSTVLIIAPSLCREHL